MYLKEEVIKLEKQTRQLLDEEKNGIAPQKTGALREVLKFHEYRYYIENAHTARGNHTHKRIFHGSPPRSHAVAGKLVQRR